MGSKKGFEDPFFIWNPTFKKIDKPLFFMTFSHLQPLSVPRHGMKSLDGPDPASRFVLSSGRSLHLGRGFLSE